MASTRTRAMSGELLDTLQSIYLTHAARFGERTPFVEVWLNLPKEAGTPTVNAPQKNEPARTGLDEPEFVKLFTAIYRDELLLAYSTLMDSMRLKPLANCTPELDGLDFLQFVVARALWEYRFDVGSELESFARRFDRLDVLSERERLYAEAQ